MILITCSNYVPHLRNADRTDQSQGLEMECEKKINREDTRCKIIDYETLRVLCLTIFHLLFFESFEGEW